MSLWVEMEIHINMHDFMGVTDIYINMYVFMGVMDTHNNMHVVMGVMDTIISLIGCCFWLAALSPSNILVYLRDESAQTTSFAATLR